MEDFRMQIRLISLRLTAAVALCTGLMVAAAHSGEVRDHRSGSGGGDGGGVHVTNTTHHGGSSSSGTTRDHRTKPVVRDHRKKTSTGFCFGGLFGGTNCY
jgi:hypothetical protein